ncbi:MAG TPA: ABC transporter permease [Arachnia sp.]|nr:ABC transporter permease [Arachnia sp.]
MRGSVTRIGAIARKEFRHLTRDWRMLVAVLVLPVIELLLFSMAISFDVRNVPTIVVDADRTPASRTFVQTFSTSSFFHVVGSTGDVADVDDAFVHGRARIAVFVQPGFEAAVQSGRKAEVGVLIDGSEPNAARMGQAYTIALAQFASQKITADWADRQGLDLRASGLIEPRVRTWYNPDRSSSIFLIPGLMVVIIMIVTVQQTAVTLVRERDLHTREQMLISPLRLPELMLGKLLPWTALAFFDMVAIAVVGLTVYGVPLRGSVPALALASALFVFCSLGLGLLVSAIAPSLETANIVAMLVSFFPAFLLSGFAFPLEAVPVALQWISRIFPARYMVDASRAVFLKGAGFADIASDLVSLAVYAVVVLVAATVLYRRTVRR